MRNWGAAVFIFISFFLLSLRWIFAVDRKAPKNERNFRIALAGWSIISIIIIYHYAVSRRVCELRARARVSLLHHLENQLYMKNLPFLFTQRLRRFGDHGRSGFISDIVRRYFWGEKQQAANGNWNLCDHTRALANTHTRPSFWAITAF